MPKSIQHFTVRLASSDEYPWLSTLSANPYVELDDEQRIRCLVDDLAVLWPGLHALEGITGRGGEDKTSHAACDSIK
jgi:hypothetical protein